MPDVNDVRFVAIDFETADPKRDSACAVGIVVVEGGEIVARDYRLIRPPRSKFNPFCVQVHGIHWADVCGEPSFGDLWPELQLWFRDADFIVAHNAAFDKSVLHTCCRESGWDAPVQPFLCTVQLSKKTWALPSNKLPAVCAHLGIELNHHNAASDAEACALIAVSGLRENPAFLGKVL
ncbi:MAG: 3'-5' exonuclease [Pseudodesulfovibrio sp.]|jgi:DNA polymerase-3 subunit epsilon|uniref:DNA polymerase-3 subunit epsilon n=1 Tax=Pseudodesulfovibrio indicus TaxID=1716143 RepID=A0A126QT72_9BACT|nr:3'-5' exonuclease [Pseudodesulfovibrio indicus]AMK12917.1 exonuclease [Pseudodesulfovibrio indicus]TDT89114.1 DNA polymerase-3 subunit epsilon [Pseudodesulfovibrio indicus]